VIRSTLVSVLCGCSAALAGRVVSPGDPTSLVHAARNHRNRLHWKANAPVFAFIAGMFLGVPETAAHDTRMDGHPSNDWIDGLKNSIGQACCGNNDCRPVLPGDLISSLEGSMQVEIEGRRFSVLEGNIVPDASPDGRAWVCPDLRPALGGYMYSIRGVRCLLLPPLT